MKKALIPAFLLLLGSAVLGATVLREPLAQAAAPIASVFVTNDASSPVAVREQSLDANGNIKVHEQGTANVNVTPPLPVTGGGGLLHLTVEHLVACHAFDSPQTATALSIRMTSEVRDIVFEDGPLSVVARFDGPGSDGNGTIVLALTRPMTFDVICASAPLTGFGVASVGWVGAET